MVFKINNFTFTIQINKALLIHIFLNNSLEMHLTFLTNQFVHEWQISLLVSE